MSEQCPRGASPAVRAMFCSPRLQIVGLNRVEGVMASARKFGPGADGVFPAPVGGRRAIVVGEGVPGGGQRVKREEGRGKGRAGREMAETVLTSGRGAGRGRGTALGSG
jgi:hypothetical protein